jgi:ribosomal protein S18 acetylase RimI-like enzyme
MIKIRMASLKDVPGIKAVCTTAYYATYQNLLPMPDIKAVIEEFYQEERIKNEVLNVNREWNGYLVAIENDTVIGCIGGGMIDEQTSEVYVLYIDPNRRNEGIGTMLLDYLTNIQIPLGAKKQWVSVQKGNHLGIPFYEAKGFVFSHEQESYRQTEQVSLRYHRIIAKAGE